MEPHGNEVGWDCRVKPTLGASLGFIIIWETHLEGEGRLEKTQVTRSFAKKKKTKKKKTPFSHLGKLCSI